MNNNMRWIVALAAVGILLSVLMYGFVIPQIDADREAKIVRQRHPLTHEFGEVLQYAHPYMGNAGNLSNLFLHLPLNELHRTLALDSERLAAELRYEAAANEQDQALLKQSLIYNATAAFALIDNLHTVRFRFEDVTYEAERQDVEAWYGMDAALLTEPAIWQEVVQLPLHDLEYTMTCAATILRNEQ